MGCARALVAAGHFSTAEFADVRGAVKQANKAAHGHAIAGERVAAMLAAVERLFQETGRRQTAEVLA